MPGQTSKKSEPQPFIMRWGTAYGQVLKDTKDQLVSVARHLGKGAQIDLGLMMKIPVFIKDPLVALEEPELGIQEVDIHFEPDLADGPTSSRIAVVDYNIDTRKLEQPVRYDPKTGWFYYPAAGKNNEKVFLPIAPEPVDPAKDPTNQKITACRNFIEKVKDDPWFAQLNAWAVIQSVLDFYEAPQQLGRSIQWGFEGNRLLVVPRAGYQENAFYSRDTKSIQLYYFGPDTNRKFTCLSHDIVSHETGHAILDGIRPYYLESPSLQTQAFHEFIGDQTAILLTLMNNDIRRFVTRRLPDKVEPAYEFTDLAREFGMEVEGRPYLRTASTPYKMKDFKNSLNYHDFSQVLSSAMFDIFMGIAQRHMLKNDPQNFLAKREKRTAVVEWTPLSSLVTPREAYFWAADRMRRTSIQPLDLCPPCDIQFADYATAVLRNDILANPMDMQGYRDVMLTVFHERGLCDCDYLKHKTVSHQCAFYEAFSNNGYYLGEELICRNISHVARNRETAYYFLNENRRILRIPVNQDYEIVDLYEANKLKDKGARLPRQIVMEYLWREEVSLENDPLKKLDFGSYAGKYAQLLCGGTLVFDDLGNLLSWSHKPGTQHLDAGAYQKLVAKEKAYLAGAEGGNSQQKKPPKPTWLEYGCMRDYAKGMQRRDDLLAYYAALIKKNLFYSQQEQLHMQQGLQTYTINEDNHAISFSQVSSVRDAGLKEEVDSWPFNY